MLLFVSSILHRNQRAEKKKNSVLPLKRRCSVHRIP